LLQEMPSGDLLFQGEEMLRIMQPSNCIVAWSLHFLPLFCC
jgi:hypothetical protein